jgi:hypothetical protein
MRKPSVGRRVLGARGFVCAYVMMIVVAFGRVMEVGSMDGGGPPVNALRSRQSPGSFYPLPSNSLLLVEPP